MDGRWCSFFFPFRFSILASIYALGAWGTGEWDIISFYSGLISFR